MIHIVKSEQVSLSVVTNIPGLPIKIEKLIEGEFLGLVAATGIFPINPGVSDAIQLSFRPGTIVDQGITVNADAGQLIFQLYILNFSSESGRIVIWDDTTARIWQIDQNQGNGQAGVVTLLNPVAHGEDELFNDPIDVNVSPTAVQDVRVINAENPVQ